MARQLKARKPDAGRVTRPKILVFGPPGVRKTWESLEFPRCYYIDTEGGASLPAYQEKLRASGGAYFGKDEGSQSFDTVIGEIQTLATVQHDFLTVVIDSFSKLYNLAAAKAEQTLGNDYGRDRKEANKPTRQLMSWIERLDMNVILICHQKDKWGRANGQLVNEGVTFDGFEKMEYDLHLALNVTVNGAKVVKTRLGGFPLGATFPWSFKEVEKRCGDGVMLRPAAPVELASAAEVAEVKRLLEVVKIDPNWESDAFEKAGVSSWEQMDRDKVLACRNFLSDRVSLAQWQTRIENAANEEQFNALAQEAEKLPEGTKKKVKDVIEQTAQLAELSWDKKARRWIREVA